MSLGHRGRMVLGMSLGCHDQMILGVLLVGCALGYLDLVQVQFL